MKLFPWPSEKGESFASSCNRTNGLRQTVEPPAGIEPTPNRG
jgi:hypothetical protein